jgi:hypothetical protein
MESLAVESDDASGLLSPVLERMEPKGRDGGRIGMAEYTEDAALFAQPIIVNTSPCKGEVDSICFASKQMLSGGGRVLGAPIW